MSQALPLITRQGDRIAIVSGLRTPFARQATAFHGIPAVDLGKMVVGRCWLAAKYRLTSLSSWFWRCSDARSPEHCTRNCPWHRNERAYGCLQRQPCVCNQLSGGGKRGRKPDGGHHPRRDRRRADSSSVLPIGVSKSWPAFWWMQIKRAPPGKTQALLAFTPS